MFSERSTKRPIAARIIDYGSRTLNGAGTIFVVLVAWEILAQLGFVNVKLLPPPSILALSALDLIRTGVLVENTFGSLLRVFTGFSLATVLGVGSGLILATSKGAARRSLPFIEILRPIPPIAWIPLAILWFGLGTVSAVFIVTLGAFFPIVISTYSGIRSISQGYVNAAHSLGANDRLIMTDILFPASLPQILTGLRVGIGIAWTSVIAAEMVGVQDGLGYAIQLNRTMLETEAVVVSMIVIGLIGWGMNRLLGWLERRTTVWCQDSLAAQQIES